MANVSWTMRLYDTFGAPITAADYEGAVSNQIKHGISRQLTIPLNGVDSLNFQLYLDDPMSYQIVRLRTVVKLWRTVRDNSGGLLYQDSDPCFGGVVAYTLRNGSENTMQITCQAPFWRLQSRFHILNHYLKTNVDTGLDYKQSELMWKLIDLVNNAFGLEDSNTGIIKGTFSATNDPVVAPYFVAKGSNTWTHIFEELMNRPASPDIAPTYTHVDGDPSILVFNTEEKRGGDNTYTFRYRTGTNDNLDNLTEENQPVPGEFANYLWAVGAGGPNSGKIAMEENIDDDDDGYHNIGIYMRRADFQNIKKIGLAGPPPTHLKALAKSEFAQARIPKTNYSLEIAPGGEAYYAHNYNVGDTVHVLGSKGSLSVDTTQRIYDATLQMSENNMESVAISVADDFTDSFIT
jgi:hypothetical protein